MSFIVPCTRPISIDDICGNENELECTATTTDKNYVESTIAVITEFDADKIKFEDVKKADVGLVSLQQKFSSMAGVKMITEVRAASRPTSNMALIHL